MNIVHSFLLLLLTGACAFAAVPWHEVLGPSQGTVPPPPDGSVKWRDNLQRALDEAKREGRPLFVTLRCLPCKQCADFDKEVLEGGPDLDPILKQFVTVRLINAEHLDLRIFPVEGFQDLDLSWWGWFLSPEGQVYGIFGGKDHVSESTRISKQALINTLQRVLKHHYDPRRTKWNIDGPVPDLSGKMVMAFQLPGWKSWEAERSKHEKITCLHCHQLNDVLRQPAIDAKTFDKRRDVEVWPLPENVGITLDRDHGLLVKAVEPNSAAGRTGLRTGDQLGAAAGRRLFGQADFRGVLHRGPRDAGRIEVVWLREGKPFEGAIEVKPGWRKTVLDWRMSISQGNIGAYPGFFPLAINAGKRKQLDLSESGMAIEPYMGNNTNSAPYKAGLRGRDVVTAVNGQTTNLNGRAFLVWFRQQYDGGDEVTLGVRAPNGQSRNVTYKLSTADN
jgi:serine protease Do